MKHSLLVVLTSVFVSLLTLPAAAITGQAGPYAVDVTTDPPVIALGHAHLNVLVTLNGKPAEGVTVRALTAMPGMAMGEREEPGLPQPGRPGLYVVPAAFAMAGGYTANLRVSGPAGSGTASVPLQTGQDTTANAGGLLHLLLMVGAALLILAMLGLLLRKRDKTHTGVNGQSVGWALALAAMLAAAVFVVNHWRRPGAMTPLEAQGMEMDLPAPTGTTPVVLARVRRGSMASTVSYSGQAVGFVEQDVYPRTQGRITWMPFYTGSRVRRGQILARLDTSQIRPQVAEREAALRMAEQGVQVAQGQYGQAEASVEQAESEVGMRVGAVQEARSGTDAARAGLVGKRQAWQAQLAEVRRARSEVALKLGALAEAIAMRRRAGAGIREASNAVAAARAAISGAESDETAAGEDRTSAVADVAGAQSQVADADAQLQAAQADAAYWSPEVARMRALLKQGAVSREEFEREQAQAQTAEAKVAQAKAKVEQMATGVRSAEARVRRADAMAKGAASKARQAQAALEGSESRLQQQQTDVPAAEAKVQQAEAEVRGAREMVNSASARAREAGADVDAAGAVIAGSQAKVAQSEAELQAHHAHVRSEEATLGTGRGQIGQAQAGVQQAASALAAVAATQGYADVRSTIDGVVTQRLISPGVLVSPGQAVLRLAQLDPIRLQANVAESDLSRLHPGSPVTIRKRTGGDLVVATVSSVAPSVDPTSRMGLVEAVIPNPATNPVFSPGEYVVLDLSTGSARDALQIPTEAIQWRADEGASALATHPQPSVWVAEQISGAGWTVHRVTVSVGITNSVRTQVLSGLKEGQHVVAEGFQYLQEGQDVSVTVQSSGEPASRVTRAQPVPQAGAKTEYTCPMHPDVVRDQPGNCPKCGMALVPRRGKISWPAPARPKAIKTLYTCLMHPEVVSDKPGKCPKCGMALVPRQAGAP